MKKSSKLVKYLPINNSIMPAKISDLHVIMALAHENNRSREKLHAMDKGIVPKKSLSESCYNSYIG